MKRKPHQSWPFTRAKLPIEQGLLGYVDRAAALSWNSRLRLLRSRPHNENVHPKLWQSWHVNAFDTFVNLIFGKPTFVRRDYYGRFIS